MQRRVFVIVLDSLGIGALPDAKAFGDEGAHTLDHLVDAAGGLDVPELEAIGLGHVHGVTRVGAAPSARRGKTPRPATGR